MAFSKRVAMLGIVCAGYASAVGCSDDGDQVSGSAGKAGQSGGGGSASVGGSASKTGGVGGLSTAGKGGQGGTAGKAGQGGTAGKAGSTGTAGEAGESHGGAGGDSPMHGGAGEGGAAGAGGMNAGGAGGAAGAGGAPQPMAAQCSFHCSISDDCTINNGPVEVCNQTTHVCEDPTAVCAQDADCMPSLSFWAVTCTDNSGCDPNLERCVSWQGQGYCAPLPDPGSPDFPCNFGVPTSVPSMGAQGNVQVCASADPRCFGGACSAGCGDTLAGGCPSGGGDTCSKNTGLCECQSGTECKTGVCGKDSHCVECLTSDDCSSRAAAGLDTCVAGKCGCSAPASCPDPGYKNATAVCQ